METPNALTADRDHLAIGQIVVSKIVFLWLAINDVLEESSDFVVGHVGLSKNFLHVELKVASQAWTKFAVAGKTKFVATLTEVEVCHGANEADELAVHCWLLLKTLKAKL